MRKLCGTILAAVALAAAHGAEPNGVADKRERVLSYLRSLPQRQEKKLIAGQQCSWWPSILVAGLGELTKTCEKTGKFPALAGFDYCETMRSVSEPTLYKPPRWRDINPFIKEWSAKGGLVTISAHMTNPWTGTNAWDLSGSGRLPELLQPDTESRKAYWRVVEGIADGLEDLQKSGVVVLWRPFHECEGGWFWWGGEGENGSRAAVLRELWREMHGYMTQRRKLNNLIWVFNGKSCHYPGDDVVDLNSADIYANNVGERIAKLMPGMASNDVKPFALAEFGPFHPHLKLGREERYDYSGFAREVLSAAPNCVYFLAWHTQWSLWYNDAGKLMSDPLVVTLDDLRKEMDRVVAGGK